MHIPSVICSKNRFWLWNQFVTIQLINILQVNSHQADAINFAQCRNVSLTRFVWGVQNLESLDMSENMLFIMAIYNSIMLCVLFTTNKLLSRCMFLFFMLFIGLNILKPILFYRKQPIAQLKLKNIGNFWGVVRM